MARASRWILLTGATGYVGGRLLRVLEAKGEHVRCIARRPQALEPGLPTTEVVAGDLLASDETLARALSGVDVAYYLVHSMASEGPFEERDRRAAEHFALAAAGAEVRRIVFLGGLGESGPDLSPHLRSRHEVGEVLRASGVQTIELRASIVIGAGSLSFEMIRSLVGRLPVMITPRWVSNLAQPIAIGDLLHFLEAAADLEVGGNPIYEVGGADQVSYRDLMTEYARQCGLRRVLLAVPVLSPWLSSLWLHLVTPIYARVGRALIESIRHPTVVRDETAIAAFGFRPVGYREAIAAALREATP